MQALLWLWASEVHKKCERQLPASALIQALAENVLTMSSSSTMFPARPCCCSTASQRGCTERQRRVSGSGGSGLESSPELSSEVRAEQQATPPELQPKAMTELLALLKPPLRAKPAQASQPDRQPGECRKNDAQHDGGSESATSLQTSRGCSFCMARRMLFRHSLSRVIF
jgi:hypothetical protein